MKTDYNVRITYDAHPEDPRGPRPAYCAPFVSFAVAADWTIAHLTGRHGSAVVFAPSGEVVGRFVGNGRLASEVDHA